MDTYLGIDTSCYTTSLCLVDETYDIAADERIILTVPKGRPRPVPVEYGLPAHAQLAGPL